MAILFNSMNAMIILIQPGNLFPSKANNFATPCVGPCGPAFLNLADRCHSVTNVAAAALCNLKCGTAKLTSQSAVWQNVIHKNLLMDLSCCCFPTVIHSCNTFQAICCAGPLSWLTEHQMFYAFFVFMGVSMPIFYAVNLSPSGLIALVR